MSNRDTKTKANGPRVHRGRSKEGTVPITIRLTPDEIAQLDALAESHLRSRTAHATWLIIQALRGE